MNYSINFKFIVCVGFRKDLDFFPSCKLEAIAGLNL